MAAAARDSSPSVDHSAIAPQPEKVAARNA
jgi:hypothetical protein